MNDYKSNSNRGFSLVELLVAIAVLSIAMVGITGLVRMAATYYADSHREVDIQNQLQVTFAQVSNMIIDANVDVSFDSGKAVIVNTNGYYVIEHKAQKLYVAEGTFPDPSVADAVKIANAKNAGMIYDNGSILADRVETFLLDVSDVANGRVVLAIRLTNAGRSAYLSQNVFMRNSGDEEAHKLSDYAVSRTQSGTNVTVSITNKSGADIPAGTTLQFVLAMTVDGTSINFTSSDGFSAITRDESAGTISTKLVTSSTWAADGTLSFTITGVSSVSEISLQDVIK